MEEIIFDETSEEYKAIKWLENKTTNYSDDSLVLHYNNILYYLIINLMKKNEKLQEELQKANDTLDTHNELINHLEERIEKATEYIKIYRSYEKINEKDYLKGRDEIGSLNLLQVDKLLEILRGE